MILGMIVGAVLFLFGMLFGVGVLLYMAYGKAQIDDE